MFKATVKNATRGHALNSLCLMAALFAVVPVAYGQNDTVTTAVQGQSCAVDRYNAVNNLTGNQAKSSLNCTAADFVATATATSPIGFPCPVGTKQPIDLTLELKSGNATRYDAALFVEENAGNPNTQGGTCSVDVFPTSGLLDGTTSWFDASNGSPTNTCGDYNPGSDTFNLVQGVMVTCQYDNTNHLAIPFMLTYGNSVSGGGNPPTCTGAADAATFPVSAGTVAKCNVVSVVVTNVNVAFNADPACSKTISFDPGTLTVTATIHIVNNDPVNGTPADNAPNVPFDDIFLAPVTPTNVSCTNQSLGAQCWQDVVAYPVPTIVGQEVKGQIPFLPVGGSVDVVVTGTIPALDPTPYTNTATLVIDPANFPANVAANDTCPSNSVPLPVKLQSFDVK